MQLDENNIQLPEFKMKKIKKYSVPSQAFFPQVLICCGIIDVLEVGNQDLLSKSGDDGFSGIVGMMETI